MTGVSPDFIPSHIVNAALRANLPFFAIACIAFTAGLSSLLLAWFRSRDRLLLWVGVFSLLYAVRLFLNNELFERAINTQRADLFPWTLCLTYLIPIPYALFGLELFGGGWRGVIALWLWFEVVFAVVAIPVSLFTHQLKWTDPINGVLVIGGTVLILVHVIVSRRDPNCFAASLTWPLIVFGIVVVLTNRGYSRPAGIEIEPIGFLVLLAGLGITAARRALASERKLMEVEQELATARRIQHSIIPQSLPSLPCLHLATRYQPMTSVAGDFYDFLNTSEHCLTILVADVSGHGVPAALVASMLKICFAAQREHANNPAEILAGLNVMLRGSLGGQYVTAACAAIDVAARRITYAGAGHPPGLLVRRSTCEIVQLAENGLFIGPFPMATYSNTSLTFQSGDDLLLYTDGIIEAPAPDGNEFGIERLQRFLQHAQDLHPTELVERLFQQISTGEQQDDLTVVLAHLE
jgi:sigma-B regulation protein RsbU (phosphoserine phosphatase)